ncbi:MAG: thiamine pyrophosphate-binding protein [Chloroflexi bacterium]|nr:thiamine pyrophosphate-binding protein [Chloroflexota bacterium]
MPKITAGQAVVESLRAEGCKYAFGIVGGTFLEILDAFYDQKDIKFISVRHEQGAAFMADGFARASGIPGVCMSTNGPGATNLITGVYAAYVGHSPVLAISGAPAREVMYRDAFQEIDHISLFRPITKLAMSLNKSDRVPEMMRHAFRVAMSGKKGPVFVDFPRDLLDRVSIDAELQPPTSYRTHQRLPGDPALVRQAAQALRSARRPVIIAGGGVTESGATQQVVELADLLSIPMITSYGRNDAVPNEHPLYVGPLGRGGSPEAGELCAKADVILAAGTRLSNFTTYYDNRYISKDARIIQIEIDEKEIGRNYPVTLGIQGDARTVLRELLEGLRAQGAEGGEPPWRREAEGLKAKRQQRMAAEGRLTGPLIKPQRVYAEMRKVITPETIMVLDAGACPAYGYDRLEFHRPRTFITPLDLGGLGFAFPEALGAKLGRPDAPVIAIHGDGGFLFNVQELETAVREKIATITLVMNNGVWGSEKAYQAAMFGDRPVGSDITNPRFDKLAQLFGANGFYVDRVEDVGDALKQAMASDLPSVIEMPVDPKELPVPARVLEAERR